MFKNIIIVLLSFLIITSCQFREGFFYYMGIGNTVTFGGSSYDWVDSITTDEEGNIYLAGRFYETVDFNPREGEELKTAQTGSSDIYLVKLNADYTFGWSRVIGGVDWEKCGGLAAANGMVYLAGSFSGATDFNGWGGGDLRTAVNANEFFLTAINSSGDYQFTITKQFNYNVKKVLLDRGGTIYTFYQVSEPPLAYGLLKTDSRGNEIWNVEIMGGGICDDMSWGENGKLYGAGYINNGNSDYYIAEIDPQSGSCREWSFGGPDNEWIKAVTADGNGLYIAGNFSNNSLIGGELLGDGSGKHMILAKLSYDCQVEWVNSLKSLYVSALEKTDSTLYIGGDFTGTVNFDPHGTRLFSSEQSTSDIYLSSFTLGGRYLETRFIRSSGQNYESTLHSNRGSLYWGGNFYDEVNFKTKSDGADDIRRSKGYNDIFMTIIVD